MMTKADFENISLDLQRLAFNLADELETLNFHSVHEAVSEMRRGVLRISAEMSDKVRVLMRRGELLAEYFPELPIDEKMAEFIQMDDLLDVVRKCTGEPKNYKDFIETMPELIAMCDKWGKRDPLCVQEAL